MSPKIWFISDTHLGNHKIATGGYKNLNRKRPTFSSSEEHHEWLVDMWNSSVGKRDVVYHLGDVADSVSGLQVVKRLRGIKHLILGNHDQFGIDRYRSVGFMNRILGSMRYKKNFILSHIPIHETQLEYRWRYNIHGHIHDIGKYPSITNDRRYINANLCAIGKIITFEELIDGREYESK